MPGPRYKLLSQVSQSASEQRCPDYYAVLTIQHYDITWNFRGGELICHSAPYETACFSYARAMLSKLRADYIGSGYRLCRQDFTGIFLVALHACLTTWLMSK